MSKNKKIDEIILAIPSASSATKSEIVSICKETSCKLKTLPSMDKVIQGKFNMSKLRDVSIEDLLGREEVKLDDSCINKYIKDKVVLVTGGGDLLGQNFVDK